MQRSPSDSFIDGSSWNDLLFSIYKMIQNISFKFNKMQVKSVPYRVNIDKYRSICQLCLIESYSKWMIYSKLKSRKEQVLRTLIRTLDFVEVQSSFNYLEYWNNSKNHVFCQACPNEMEGLIENRKTNGTNSDSIFSSSV